jgi:hypothetical protein
MANEINYSVNLSARKGGAVVNPGAITETLTMAGDDMIQTTQVIGTSAEAISFGEVSGAPAVVVIKNLDATNFVLVGFTNPPTEIKILAGGALLMTPATATIYAKADTAACRILVCAAEA